MLGGACGEAPLISVDASTASGRTVLLADRHPTSRQVLDSAAELVRRHPRACRLRTVGRSRAGRPLHLLSVGHGPRHALVVAGAHANEAAGGATVIELAHRALADLGVVGPAPAAPLRDPDLTWHFLLCLDPDAALLAEVGPREPGVLLDHFRAFHRQAPDEQPEWAPSVGAVLPESRALLELIDELRPFVQCSLHTIELGGAFVQSTAELPGLAEAFGKSAAELGIPLDLGPYDTLYWPSPGPGAYLMPPVAEVERSAAASWAVGTTTWHAPHRYGGSTVIIEVPLWAGERAADAGPLADPAPGLIAAADRLRGRGRLVERLYAATTARLGPEPGPGLRTARETLRVLAPIADDWDPRVPQPGAPAMPPMTGARLAGVEAWSHCLPLRVVALLRRALLERPTGAGRPGGDLADRLDGLLAHWCAEYQRRLGGVWVPAVRQIEQQARAVRSAVELARPGR
ncbi:M14 family zinc carboxypeptidase [Kitasatospora viridis]|uniref:Zinc carboxypeptidase n=1 Tax=Kitasatospora viridis TaxID=281105 RepID=A0A561UIF1_9ACTN|nr:M14 family zinc carboxypeptidase [Kitasatospora viridis]TWF99119.1 zinc carboxypeptidase [Kitasatospora viridis]